MFYNARYYDPGIGRFISPDTIVPDPANPQDLNRYSYVRNDPVNHVDPSGHVCTCKFKPLSFEGRGGRSVTLDQWRSFVADGYRYGGKANPDRTLRTVGSIAADFIPGLGDGKGFTEALRGREWLTGNELNWFERGLGLVFLAEIRHIVDTGDAATHAIRATDNLSNAPRSAHIDPGDIANRTPQQIDDLANDAGLIPRGPDPQAGRGAYIDPVTGEQRILCHPGACPPHAHVNDPAGNRLDISGNIVSPESPAAHLPLSTDASP